MKLLGLLLVVVGFAAGAEEGYYDITFELLEKWVEALEHDFYQVVSEVSDLNTLTHIGQDRLNYIHDHFLPHIHLVNTQQEQLSESVRKQAKALQHVVDELHAHEAGVASIAETTRDLIYDHESYYFTGNDSEITGVNQYQDTVISDLQMEVADCKQEYLDDLAANITSLEMQEEYLANQVYSLKHFVSNRKCEYGHAILDLNTATKVYFKTKFNTVPSVTATMNGLFVHLDNPDHAKGTGYAAYALGKFALTYHIDHFLVEAAEPTTGQLRGKVISCVWMACEGLDQDYV